MDRRTKYPYAGIDLSLHRDELIAVLERVIACAGGRRQKTFPNRYARAIWDIVTGREPDKWSVVPLGIKHSIRQIHDFYGWMAKPGTVGLCAGTIYRTELFTKIPLTERNGTKDKNKRTVHIEHTVPIADLERILRANHARFHCAADLHKFLMRYSVCVAFSRKEELLLGTARVPTSRNDAFDGGGKLVHSFPFRRYRRLVEYMEASGSEAFRVFDIVHGTTIDMQRFSFDDHVDVIRSASRLSSASNGRSLYSPELFGDGQQ